MIWSYLDCHYISNSHLKTLFNAVTGLAQAVVETQDGRGVNITIATRKAITKLGVLGSQIKQVTSMQKLLVKVHYANIETSSTPQNMIESVLKLQWNLQIQKTANKKLFHKSLHGSM